MSTFAGLTRNYLISWFAPSGTTTTELNPAYKGAAAVALSPPARGASVECRGRLAKLQQNTHLGPLLPLSQINTKNAGKLKVLCTYDVGQFAAFESGLIMVNNALIGTTQFDIFSLNPTTCAENWRTHEDYPPALLSANRGAAYIDGMLFRGTQDGRVLAYDFKTGKRVWATTIANTKLGETVPSAPIAWDGLVFVGNAGGDYKGGKGHMFALEPKTGKIVWEFFLAPKDEGDVSADRTVRRRSTWRRGKTRPASPSAVAEPGRHILSTRRLGSLYVPGGNPAPDFVIGVREGGNLYTDSVVVLDAKSGDYKYHFKIVPKDWHDWDVSNPPVLIQTMGGKQLMVGRAERWTPLWLRSRHQWPPVPGAGDPGRGSQASLYAGRGRPFLPGRGGRRGMEQPGLRSADELYPRRRGRLVRHRDTQGCRTTSVGYGRATMGRNGDMESVQHVRQRRPYGGTLGRDGSTPSTPTPASGSGA